MFVMTNMLVLFGQFYVQTYTKKKREGQVTDVWPMGRSGLLEEREEGGRTLYYLPLLASFNEPRAACIVFCVKSPSS